MTQTGDRAPTFDRLKWLSAPLAVALLVLVGLAVSTEDRETFLTGQPSDELELDPAGGSPPGGEMTAPSLDEEENTATVGLGYDDGKAGVDLGGAAPSVAPRNLDGEPLTVAPLPLPLDAEPTNGSTGRTDDDRPAGYRLTPAGGLEPVTGASIRPGDAVLRAVGSEGGIGSGVDLLLPDGAHAEVRLTADSITVTAVAPSGRRTPIETTPGGRTDLGDGLTLDIPGPDPLTTGGDVAEGGSVDEPALDPLRLAALVLLAVVAGGLLVWLGRHRRAAVEEEPFGPTFVSDAGVPEERFDEFIAMLAADRDPARAIRLAFSAAERGVGGLPRRLTTETPFEWSERVVPGRVELAAPLRSLCDRFALTRFAPEAPTLADRDAAIADLVAVNRLATRHNLDSARHGVAGAEPDGGQERAGVS